MVPLYFIGPKVREPGRQARDLLHRQKCYRTDTTAASLSVVLALLSIIAFIPYLTLQMKGAGYILNTLSEGRIAYWLGALVTYSIVMIYVFTSGVMGIGWTNAFQGMFMMVIAWFLGIYLPYTLYGGIGPMFEQIAATDMRAMLEAPGLTSSGDPSNWWTFSSAVLISALGFSMWPHLFMKSYAAKSSKALKLTIVLYPTFQLFLVPILLIGFAGVIAFPGVSPSDTIVPHILMQESIGLSGWVIGLVCAGTLAASMSSGDAIVHAAASIGIRDGLSKVITIPEQNQHRWMQVLVLPIGAIAYYFAVVSEVDIVDLLLGSYGIIAQVFPLVFAAFYWPRATGKGALWGLLAAILVNVFFYINPDLKPVPLHEGIYGLVANLIVFVSVSLNTPPEPRDTLALYNPTIAPEKEAYAAAP